MITTEVRNSTSPPPIAIFSLQLLQMICAFLDEEMDGANSSKTAEHSGKDPNWMFGSQVLNPRIREDSLVPYFLSFRSSWGCLTASYFPIINRFSARVFGNTLPPSDINLHNVLASSSYKNLSFIASKQSQHFPTCSAEHSYEAHG